MTQHLLTIRKFCNTLNLWRRQFLLFIANMDLHQCIWGLLYQMVNMERYYVLNITRYTSMDVLVMHGLDGLNWDNFVMIHY